MVFVQLETSLAVLRKPVNNYEAEFVFSLRTECLAAGLPGPAPGSRPTRLPRAASLHTCPAVHAAQPRRL